MRLHYFLVLVEKKGKINQEANPGANKSREREVCAEVPSPHQLLFFLWWGGEKRRGWSSLGPASATLTIRTSFPHPPPTLPTLLSVVHFGPGPSSRVERPSFFLYMFSGHCILVHVVTKVCASVCKSWIHCLGVARNCLCDVVCVGVKEIVLSKCWDCCFCCVRFEVIVLWCVCSAWG